MESTQPKTVAALLKERARLDAELERFQRLVTVMFTDVAGSTRYFDQHGDLAGMAMLEEVNETLQPLIQQHEGTIVKTIGDAIMAYFENPVPAVRCSIAMQQAIENGNQSRTEPHRIRIRVALNLGVGLLKDNDVFGDVVNVCSRIEHATEAGRIGVSPSVVESASDEPGIAWRKMGAVPLRGKPQPLELYEILWRKEEIESAAPAEKVSGEQLAMATGTRLGLDDEVRRAIAAAVRGKSQTARAPTLEKKKFTLVEVLPDRTLGQRHPLAAEQVVIGREKGDIVFPGDALMSREHALLTLLGGALYVEDLESANGTFVRLRAPHTLQHDDIVLFGRQMFRFRLLGVDDTAAPGKKGEVPKKLLETWSSAGPLAELIRLDRWGNECEHYPLSRGETIFGRTQGTYSFPDDRYLSRSHVRFNIHGPRSVLEDLNSTNGTYVRIRERHLLDEEDTVLVGSQFLRVVSEPA